MFLKASTNWLNLGLFSTLLLSSVTSTNPAKAQSSQDINLTQTCTNHFAGYTVDYPKNWQTNSEADLQVPDSIDPNRNAAESCSIFDAGDISIEYGTEDFSEAIYFDVENIPFERLSKNSDNAEIDVLTRKETSVNGREAVIVETQDENPEIGPSGRTYRYLIDYGDRTLVVRTYEAGTPDYATKKRIVNRMMQNLNFREDLPTENSDLGYAKLEDAAAESLPTLTLSDRGDRVRQLQAFLADRGYYDTNRDDISIDGNYDEETARSVEQFQDIHQLNPSGIVNGMTWREIIAATKDVMALPPSQRNSLQAYRSEIRKRVEYNQQQPIYADEPETDRGLQEYRQDWQDRYGDRAELLGQWGGPFGISMTLFPTENPDRLCVQYQDEYTRKVTAGTLDGDRLQWDNHLGLRIEDRFVAVWDGADGIENLQLQIFPTDNLPSQSRQASFQEQYDELGCRVVDLGNVSQNIATEVATLIEAIGETTTASRR